MPNWIESMNKCTGPRNFAEAYGIVTREGKPLPSGHPCAHGCRMNLGRVGIDRSCQLSGCAHDTVNEAAPISPVAWAKLRQCTSPTQCSEPAGCVHTRADPWDSWKSGRDL